MNSPPDSSASPRARRCALRPRAGTGRTRRRGFRPDIGSRGTARAAARSCGVRCVEQVAAPSKRRPNARLGHLIPRPPAEHIGQRRLARPVRPHDRMHLARVHGERQPLRIGLSATVAWRLSISSIVSPSAQCATTIAALARPSLRDRIVSHRSGGRLRACCDHSIAQHGHRHCWSSSLACARRDASSCHRDCSRVGMYRAARDDRFLLRATVSVMIRLQRHGICGISAGLTRCGSRASSPLRESSASHVGCNRASPRASGMHDHPTLPSRLIPSSFCASTANSIGSCLQHLAGEAVDDQRHRRFRRRARATWRRTAGRR